MAWLAAASERLREVYAGEPWYGKPVHTILGEIDPAKAGIAPAPDQHSLYQLTRHMLTWRVFVLERLRGNVAYQVTVNSGADWIETPNVTPEQWANLLAEYDRNQQELLATLAAASEETLDRPVEGKPYNYRKLVEGLADHEIYHAGQLVTTAKAVGAYRPR